MAMGSGGGGCCPAGRAGCLNPRLRQRRFLPAVGLAAAMACQTAGSATGWCHQPAQNIDSLVPPTETKGLLGPICFMRLLHKSLGLLGLKNQTGGTFWG